MVAGIDVKEQLDLAVIICTYNREELLLDCILSFSLQQVINRKWQVIVVNNFDQPFSKATSDFLISKDCVILHEPNPGLSKARNKGFRNSYAKWLGFIDDDAKVPSNFIEQAFANIDSNTFDCFGGAIESWWKYGQPRWLADDFGSKPKLSTTRIILNEGYNWGSNIFIKYNALESIDGFPERIGMQGEHIGYAAENIVQIKLRKNNCVIGYDPELILEHVVMPHKLKLWWHVKAAYAEGRDAKEVFEDQYGIVGFSKSIKKCFTQPIKGFFNWVTEKDFYWEHLILISSKPFANLTGKFRSKF